MQNHCCIIAKTEDLEGCNNNSNNESNGDSSVMSIKGMTGVAGTNIDVTDDDMKDVGGDSNAVAGIADGENIGIESDDEGNQSSNTLAGVVSAANINNGFNMSSTNDSNNNDKNIKNEANIDHPPIIVIHNKKDNSNNASSVTFDNSGNNGSHEESLSPNSVQLFGSLGLLGSKDENESKIATHGVKRVDENIDTYSSQSSCESSASLKSDISEETYLRATGQLQEPTPKSKPKTSYVYIPALSAV